jgi:dephospho-CoA kinase
MVSSRPTRTPRADLTATVRAVPVIGLTGGIGGGKSAVASLLKEHGAAVIDADSVGHVVLTEPDICRRVVDRFGAHVLTKTDERSQGAAQIDRRALGKVVFADAQARRDLELIVHPRMRAIFQETIDQLRTAREVSSIVLDAAILLEAGWDDLCDVTVYVDAPSEERFARVERQRGWSRSDFEAREHAQWPCDQKRSHSQLVITNLGGEEALRREVQRVERDIALLTEPSRTRPD